MVPALHPPKRSSKAVGYPYSRGLPDSRIGVPIFCHCQSKGIVNISITWSSRATMQQSTQSENDCSLVFLHNLYRTKLIKLLYHCTEVRFACFLSGGFTNTAVINPPERKLAKRTSVQCSELSGWKAKSSLNCCAMYRKFNLFVLPRKISKKCPQKQDVKILKKNPLLPWLPK